MQHLYFKLYSLCPKKTLRCSGQSPVKQQNQKMSSNFLKNRFFLMKLGQNVHFIDRNLVALPFLDFLQNFPIRQKQLHFLVNFDCKVSIGKSNSTAMYLSLMGEGFIGGIHPPFTIFFYFRLRSLRYEKYFLQKLSKLSQASMVKFFHFSDEWEVVSVASQREGVYTPHKSRGIFYRHIDHGKQVKHFVWT